MRRPPLPHTPVRPPVPPLAVAAAALLSLAGCSGAQSMLEPRGPGADAIATLWWVLLAIMTAVFVVVMIALGYALFHRRREAVDDSEPAERKRVALVILAGAGVPSLILIGIFAYTLAVLDAFGPTVTDPDELEITIIGKQFWWDIRYATPAGDTVVTANELHMPVGRRVTLRLESDNVIHSVWIPKLHGKTDMIPGRTNRMWLQADEPGVYWGQCAEYCGEQHAWMKMLVVAEPEEEFRAWLERQRRPAAPAPPAPDPASEAMDHAPPPAPDSVREAGLARSARIRRGREVFLDPDKRCTDCHAIRGVSEPSSPVMGSRRPRVRPTEGPDLTHVASRRTIAGGMLRTTRGNMGGWIANPQVLKPGNLMPRIPMEPEEMNALLEYLMSLR